MSLSELFAWAAAWPLLLLAPLVWLATHLLDRARARRLARVIGRRAGVLAMELGPVRRRVRRALVSIALLLAAIAVMQPMWGVSVRRVEQRRLDVIVCLDVSRSMLARDVSPSRLQRAQRQIRDLSARMCGDRLGLVVFAGEARLMVPLTRDMASFAELAALAEPISVRRGGTDLGAALTVARAAFDDDAHGVVLLITDGEDLEQRGLRAAETLAKANTVVHCVGIGSPLGSKIALRDDSGETFLRDREGREIVSALDVDNLRSIAAATGGAFVDASSSARPLLDLYETHVSPMALGSRGDGEGRQRENRFQWPLLGAFVLWLLALCLTDRTANLQPNLAHRRQPT